MSSTSDVVGVMSPEQERLLYSIVQQLSETSQQVSNLHSTLYENGFLARMKKIENWIDNAQKEHVSMCPVAPKLEAHIKSVADKEKSKREWKIRKTDWFFAAIALLVAFVASVPSWINLIGGN